MGLRLAQIYRYPVKGLDGHALKQVNLQSGQALPSDRRFAIAQGTQRPPGEEGRWRPLHHFVQLENTPKLAGIRAEIEDETGCVTLRRRGRIVCRGRLTDPPGRAILTQFLGAFLARDIRGMPWIEIADSQPFLDVEAPWLSLVSLDSVQDLERVARAPAHPLRFRANLYLQGARPWEERQWIGCRLRIGAAVLAVRETIPRTAATNIDPDTRESNLNIPLILKTGFEHQELGVYAEVLEGGPIVPGDPVMLLDPETGAG